MQFAGETKTTYIIALDVGTSNAKAVLFGPDGTEIDVEEHGFALSTPAQGEVEQDGEEVLEAAIRVLEELVASIPTSPEYSAVLSISGQGGSFIPVDESGTPLHPMITWMDSRAASLVEEWKNDGTHETIRRISGWFPQPGLPIATIAWLVRHKPDLSASASLFLGLGDYLTLKLTGYAVTDPSTAGEMLLLDRRSGEWSPELCRLAGILAEQLPEVLPSDAVVGTVTTELTERTGLPAGTRVVNGGQDHSCELYALGLSDPDEALLACGTAWVINGMRSDPDLDLIPQSMDLNFHVRRGSWSISRFLGGFGAGMNWCLRQCYCVDGRIEYESMERECLEASASARDVQRRPLCIPLSGSGHPTSGGRYGGFWGLSRHHGREDMVLAFMDGAGFELRWALESLERSGFRLRCLWMVGGAVRSRIWPQIVADVTGIETRLIDYSHGPALGAALLATTGSGLYETEEDAAAAFTIGYRELHPREDFHEAYNRKFSDYQHFVRLSAELPDIHE